MVPIEGNKVAFHAFAAGVQIYEWTGSAWVFVAPEAVLFADVGEHGEVGIHYAGPTCRPAIGLHTCSYVQSYFDKYNY